MRLFTAIEVGADVRQRVAAAVAPLRRDPVLAPSIRWVEPGNLHVTLQFLGDVPGDAGRRLVEALEPPLKLAPFEVALGDLAVFPRRGRPRGIWAGLRVGMQALELLRQAVQKRLTPLGYDVENRRYRPHLTVGRLRRSGAASREQLDDGLSRLCVPQCPWPVSCVVLMESRLGPGGSQYDVRAVMRLIP